MTGEQWFREQRPGARDVSIRRVYYEHFLVAGESSGSVGLGDPLNNWFDVVAHKKCDRSFPGAKVILDGMRHKLQVIFHLAKMVAMSIELGENILWF